VPPWGANHHEKAASINKFDPTFRVGAAKVTPVYRGIAPSSSQTDSSSCRFAEGILKS
jgi:hypothetical protein